MWGDTKKGVQDLYGGRDLPTSSGIKGRYNAHVDDKDCSDFGGSLFEGEQLWQDVKECFNSGGLVFLNKVKEHIHPFSFVGSVVLEELERIIL